MNFTECILLGMAIVQLAFRSVCEARSIRYRRQLPFGGLGQAGIPLSSLGQPGIPLQQSGSGQTNCLSQVEGPFANPNAPNGIFIDACGNSIPAELLLGIKAPPGFPGGTLPGGTPIGLPSGGQLTGVELGNQVPQLVTGPPSGFPAVAVFGGTPQPTKPPKPTLDFGEGPIFGTLLFTPVPLRPRTKPPPTLPPPPTTPPPTEPPTQPITELPIVIATQAVVPPSPSPSPTQPEPTVPTPAETEPIPTEVQTDAIVIFTPKPTTTTRRPSVMITFKSAANVDPNELQNVQGR